MTPHVVVLGAGYAGVLAALRLGRRLQLHARVTLVSARAEFVERIRLHQLAVGQRRSPVSIPRLLEGSGVGFVQAEIDAVDLARGELCAAGLRIGFDQLVLAAGSRVDRSLPGVAEHAHALDAPVVPDLARELARVAGARGRVLVCGGGLSGIELSAELASGWPGLSVTQLTRRELGPGLSEPARRHIRRFLLEQGVQLREHTAVEGLEPGAAWCAGAERIDFELCVWAGGFRAHALARAAGLAVNSLGQVQVGADLRALSHPEVWAIGDAAVVAAGTTAPLNACCKIAMPMALHAADNIARRLRGLELQPFDFRDGGVCISLGRRDAVIDLRRSDGSVRSRVITGRMGARLKEAVCRYTLARQRWERSGWWPMRPLDRRGFALDPSRPREITP